MTDPSATPAPGGPPETSEPDPRSAAVRAAVGSWTRHLVDLGGRNTLLWYRDLPTGTLDLTTAHPGGIALLMTGRPTRLSDLVREPAAASEALRRARAVHAKTTELKEERGIDTCFVAFGMATWSLPGVPRSPAAPVLLRSAQLRQVGVGAQDYVLDIAEGVELNPVLEHYLSQERGLTVDADAIEALSVAGAGFDPLPTLANLSEICTSIDGFEISPRIVLGNFSYAKLPMVADLAAHGDALADHDVIAALAGDVDALRSVAPAPMPTVADPVLDDQAALIVLDADASQQRVIETARAGANLVIEGPPGTGKSQTITNLVAALAADGKRILFVAEKRAAIDAVVGRLGRVGLGDLVLDLHDGAMAKRRLAAELGRSLEALTDPVDSGERGDVVRAQQDSARALADHNNAMHAIREPWGVSAHEVMTAIAALSSQGNPPRSRVRLRGEALAGLRAATRDETAAELERLARVGAWRADGSEDPWFDADLPTVESALEARDRVERLHQDGLAALDQTLRGALGRLSVPEDQSMADWGRTLATLADVRETLETFRPEIFDSPLDEAVLATGSPEARRAAGVNLGWWERRRIRKAARALLRPGPRPTDLHAALVDAATQRQSWRQLAGAGGRPEIPAGLDRARAAHAAAAGDLQWLDERLAHDPARPALLDRTHDDLASALAALSAAHDRLALVPTVKEPLDRLEAQGWGPLVRDLAGRGVDPDDVEDEVALVWWSSIAEDIALRDPLIGGHSGEQLRATLHGFARADRDVVASGAQQVRAAVADRVRQMAQERPEQAAVVRAEARRRRGLKPIRDLMPLAGGLITALRPCWVMSPLVVASVLPPGRWFDVVIFDEASQVPPAEAVSAIARGRQVVLSGDTRQLPPTSFFTTTPEPGTDTSAALTEGMESILDVLSSILPTQNLLWHYRSLDERLITFANRELYDGSLVTFPGTSTESVLSLETVDGQGVVDEGTATVESTRSEVNRVVALVLEHARTRPTESLGVIALGIAHATRIEEAVHEALCRADDDLDHFFDETRVEPFFVKNLERVQGDERDAIILSIGYGKTPHGRVLHRFGPLNLDGGERRLNVAITRARRRLTVVSALTAEDLDPARLKARGAQMLRDFLAYAASGGRVPDGTNIPVAGNALTQELAQRLRAQGLVVHEGLGDSADRIDLAVEDPRAPGRLVVAVDLDGPEYAAVSSSRDRDRLRADQLRRLGWTPLQIWSTDVYRDPAREVERIRAVASGESAARAVHAEEESGRGEYE